MSISFTPLFHTSISTTNDANDHDDNDDDDEKADEEKDSERTDDQESIWPPAKRRRLTDHTTIVLRNTTITPELPADSMTESVSSSSFLRLPRAPDDLQRQHLQQQESQTSAATDTVTTVTLTTTPSTSTSASITAITTTTITTTTTTTTTMMPLERVSSSPLPLNGPCFRQLNEPTAIPTGNVLHNSPTTSHLPAPDNLLSSPLSSSQNEHDRSDISPPRLENAISSSSLPDGYDHLKVIRKSPLLSADYKLPSWLTDMSQSKTHPLPQNA